MLKILHLLSSLVALALPFGVFAQITLTSADMPSPGFSNPTSQDTVVSGINFGQPGANKTYTFTGLQANRLDTILYQNIPASQAANFPNSTVAITTDGAGYLYGRNSSTQFTFDGLSGTLLGCNTFVNLNPLAKAFQFPTQYGGNFSNNNGFTKQIPGSCIGQPVSDVRITSTTTARDTIDGWGKVTTPTGSYKCLREKRVEIVSTLIEYRLLAFSPWTVLSNTVDTTVRYSYLTKETRGTVVSFTFDSLDNVTSVTWSRIPPAPPVVDMTASLQSGATYSFSSTVDGYPDTYSWDFGDGNTSTQQSPSHTYVLNGTYVVCLTVTNAGGSSTDCDTIVVTGGVNANSAPSAQDDNYAVIWPASVTIDPLANDNDPNADVITIASWCPVTNGNFGPVSGLWSYTPDSAFVGVESFCYVVCDNQSPSLCDTGWVYISVTGELPVANFQVNTSANIISATNLSQNFDGNSVWYYTSTPAGGSVPVTDTVYTFAFQDTLNDGNNTLCLVVRNAYGTDDTCYTMLYSGLAENAEGAFLSVYPNPADEAIFVQAEGEGIISLIDLSGRVLMQAAYTGSRINIPTALFPAGLYTLRYQNDRDSQISYRKLVLR